MEVTVVAAAEPGAVAFQISEVPGMAFARRTSDQVSPPPETVTVCEPGPSEDTKATSTSPVCVAPRAGVVTVPRPSTLLVASMPRRPGTGGGVALVTLSATGVVVFVRPCASVVRAATQCSPSTTVVEFQLRAYGLEVADPTTLPSTRNWTPPPPAADVLAVSATLPDTRAPSAGAPHEMGGGVVSGCRTWPAVTVLPATVTFTSVSLLASLASARSLLGSDIARNQ